jgi:hypothetical protein
VECRSAQASIAGGLERTLLLQAFYSVRSERQLMEQGINPRLLLHGEDTVFDVLGHVGEIWDGEAADGKCVSHDFGSFGCVSQIGTMMRPVATLPPQPRRNGSAPSCVSAAGQI